MSDDEIKRQICRIGRRMYDSGFVAANDGNITVKTAGNKIITTPTGVSKGFMTPEMLITVDGEGNVLSANSKWRPSSEVKMHLRVYQERPDVQAVVHAHPPYATAFAINGTPLNKPIMAEAVVSLGCVPVAGYATPSTSEVPESIAAYLEHFDAVLLANHGALAWGEDLLTAYHKLESVEFYAKLTFLSSQLGNPQLLSTAQIEQLYAIRKNQAMPGRHPGRLCNTTCDIQCSRNHKTTSKR